MGGRSQTHGLAYQLVFDAAHLVDKIQARIAQQLQSVAAQHAGQQIAIVCHGGVLDIIWRIVHGLPVDTPRAWALPNTGINHLRYAQASWQVLDWGNTAHLAKPAVVRDETIA